MSQVKQPTSSSVNPGTHMGGFTLMEVLVALAVISVALAALISASTDSVYTSNNLKDRTFAQWVAENRATEIRINKNRLVTGTTTGRVKMVHQQWDWKAVITNTPDRYVKQIVIEVRLSTQPKRLLARLASYVYQKN